MYPRTLEIWDAARQSSFLFDPRGTGKTELAEAADPKKLSYPRPSEPTPFLGPLYPWMEV